MSNSQELVARTLATYRDEIEHLAAHVSEGFDTVTDWCPRECVADESRGFEGQVLHVWENVLTDNEREAVAIEWSFGGPDDVESAIGALKDGAPDTGAIADAIEVVTDLYWDGDVFRRLECETSRSGDLLDWINDNALEVGFEGSHIRVVLGIGGPNVYLTRDWFGDSLDVYWGSAHDSWRGEAVTVILDQIGEWNE